MKYIPNLDSARIDTIIQEIKDATIKECHKCLIVFVLSHGVKHALITIDGDQVPFKRLLDAFSNSNFVSFTNKHRIFFFVCCQADAPTNNNALTELNSHSIDPDQAFGSFFIGYAAYLNYKSARSASLGTFYIYHLCQLINEDSKRSISKIHEELQGIFNEKYNDIEHGYQQPYCENLLSGEFYFSDID